jgi:hypothetical protein
MAAPGPDDMMKQGLALAKLMCECPYQPGTYTNETPHPWLPDRRVELEICEWCGNVVIEQRRLPDEALALVERGDRLPADLTRRLRRKLGGATETERFIAQALVSAQLVRAQLEAAARSQDAPRTVRSRRRALQLVDADPPESVPPT